MQHLNTVMVTDPNDPIGADLLAGITAHIPILRFGDKYTDRTEIHLGLLPLADAEEYLSRLEAQVVELQLKVRGAMAKAAS